MKTLNVSRDVNGVAQCLIGPSGSFKSWIPFLEELSDQDLADVISLPKVPLSLIKAAHRILMRRNLRTPVWIPVTQSLPDADITVMISCADGSEPVWFGYFDGVVWLTLEGSQVLVTHWMQLPEPPSA